MPMLWILSVYAVLSTIFHYQLQIRGLMPPATPLEAFGIAWCMAGLLFMVAESLAEAWFALPLVWQAQRAARRQEGASC